MTVSQMTVEELRELISAVVEEKLAMLVREDDLEIDDDLRLRLKAQQQRVLDGDIGTPLQRLQGL